MEMCICTGDLPLLNCCPRPLISTCQHRNRIANRDPRNIRRKFPAQIIQLEGGLLFTIHIAFHFFCVSCKKQIVVYKNIRK